MADRVRYHHEQDEQFSLDFVNPDLQTIGQRVVEYSGHTSIKVEEYDLDRTVYVVYTATGASGAADDLEYDLVEQIEAMDRVDAIIATRLIDVFRNVLQENYESEGERVRAYKSIEAEEIEPALDQVDWSGTAAEVAGRLASNLILKHALPNANHRTAVGMMQLYFRRVDPAFSMPETARAADNADEAETGDGTEREDEADTADEVATTNEYDWMNWVDDYIDDSKRLLTVRRKGDRFRFLEEFGCDVVVRKHGVEIDLEEYELDLPRSERWRTYAEQHERLWIEVAEHAVERAGATELLETDGLTKHEFAEALRGLE